MSKAAQECFSLLVVQNSWNGSGITPVSLASTFITMEKNKCCCKEQIIGNNPRYRKEWPKIIPTRKFSHNISKRLCWLFKLWSLYWHIFPSVVWTIYAMCSLTQYSVCSLELSILSCRDPPHPSSNSICSLPVSLCSKGKRANSRK